MRGIRQHPLSRPVAVLAAVVLVCAAAVVVLRTVPHQARLERWLQAQPGVTSVSVSAGPDREATDWSSTAWVGLDGGLTPASYSRLATAYEGYLVDHSWAGSWGLTISSGTVTLPVRDRAANLAVRDLLTRLATDPHVSRVWFENRYIHAIVVESRDPAATTAHLGVSPAPHVTVRVIRPGDGLRP